MKKAKIFLASIAILAVVGGALAFKAKQISQVYLYICITNDDYCTILRDAEGDPLNVQPANANTPNPIIGRALLIVTRNQQSMFDCDVNCNGDEISVTVE